MKEDTIGEKNGLRWRRLGTAFLLIGLMAGPIGVSYRFNGVRLSPEALDNAQLARNLLRGRGFTTGAIRPASLLFFDRTAFHPDLYRPPLPALLTAGAFRVFGVSDRAVALGALFQFWAAGLLAVYLARRTMGGAAAGVCAALYFTNAGLIRAVLEGDPSWAGSLALLGILALASRSGNRPAAGLFSGLFCALGFLASYGLLWLIMPAAVLTCLLFRGGEREGKPARYAAFLAAGFILPLLLWRWNSGYLLPPLRGAEFRMFTRAFPGESLLRETARDTFLRGAGLRNLAWKWGQGAELIYGRLLFLTGTFAAPFFWLSLFAAFPALRRSRVRWLTFAALLLAAGQFVVTAPRPETLQFLVPAAIALAAVAFCSAGEAFGPSAARLRRSATGAFVALCLVPAVAQLRLTPLPPDRAVSNVRGLREWLAEETAVISDRPEAVAWYGEAAAVFPPAGVERAMALGVVYLTPAALEFPPPPGGVGSVPWPAVYLARGRSPFWEAEDLVSLPGGHLFFRIVPRAEE